MRVPKSLVDGTLGDEDLNSPAYANHNTSWWDASQIYGSSDAHTSRLRGSAPHGKMMLLGSHKNRSFLPVDEDGAPLTGFNQNWWLGLEMLHTLFVMEHNHICDSLFEIDPSLTSDELFHRARLINSALIAKIHTVCRSHVSACELF